ncbi:hypothetical protein LDL63_32820 (plasmid) [Ensifer adhaerens]|nr:hypothetical protein LDL63_32820 [Ensifer adhaerens]
MDAILASPQTAGLLFGRKQRRKRPAEVGDRARSEGRSDCVMMLKRKNRRARQIRMLDALLIDSRVPMLQTTAFVSELIRAANEVEKLTPSEVSRLLDRSVATIRDMREQAGVAGNRRTNDVVINLGIASARVRDLSIEDIKDTLIDAADVIRALRIILVERE